MRMIPLPADRFDRLLPLLEPLAMNTLFARAVLAQGAPGRVFADSCEAPRVGYVVHRYGMSLLFGEGSGEIAAAVLAMPRDAPEWLQAAGPWHEPLERAPGVERHERVNFAFVREAARPRRQHHVVRADRSAFDFEGSVVPRSFWAGAAHFEQEGTGFVALADGRPAAIAFSAFITATQLEIGIETRPEYRGRGLAAAACEALIGHCLEHGLEPVWACRGGNTGSIRLAERLGFAVARRLPYYRLDARS